MTIRLLSVQVVKFWELIKYAVSKVERIGEVDSLGVYNRLFASLLSDKSQCFIVLDEDESVKAVCITEIVYDEIKDFKSLRIRCLYSFKLSSIDTWVEEFKVVKDMAKNEGCKVITFETANPRVLEISKAFGAIEVSTNLKVEV